MKELFVDCFAGAGGASVGIEEALGRPIDYAVNHNPKAVAVHQANHPDTHHFCENVWAVDPKRVAAGRMVGGTWFSPDCTFFSAARGGKPFRERDRAKRTRALAWIVPRWIKSVRPRVIFLENVSEFSTWGPLLEDERPDPARRGETFRRWHRQIENLGYQIDMRELRACDYGAPTSRKRLFVIARCDGQEIVFPEASHGPWSGCSPYRTAAECIDWSIPCLSIFGRKRPLAETTLRRIARGVMRYVIENPRPFIVPLTHHGERRPHPVDEPAPTVTAAHRGELALVTPFMARTAHADEGRNGSKRWGRGEHELSEPIPTVTASNDFALISPALINTRNGEREGQEPRVRDIERPYPTITAQGSQGALVAAFLARHYGGHENDGHPLPRPMSTITTQDHHHLVTSHLVKFNENSVGQDLREPLHTVMAGATRFCEVRAFLLKYYGTDQDPRLERPLGTVTSRDRFGLVTVRGEPYQIVDIGMRMLTPRELARATSFRDSYILDPVYEGKPLSKTDQVWMIGNAVPPVVAEALVRANVTEQHEELAA